MRNLLLVTMLLLLAAPAFAGGAACKIIIDDSQGMSEDVIGALRRLQATAANIDKVAAELSEYMTPAEREQALKLSYEMCDFGDEEMTKFAEKVRKLADRNQKFYVEVAKRHQYESEQHSAANQ